LGGWKLLLTTPSFGAKSVLKSMSLLKLIVKEKVIINFIMKFNTIFKIILCNIKLWSKRYLFIPFNIVPYKVQINLTNRCNSRCDYCHIWKIDNFEDEIDLEHISSFFKDINDGLIWLVLGGGEVTVVKYIEKAIIVAKESCPNLRIISFTTNALLPKKALEIALMIKQAGFEPLVTISLDGDREQHDQIRGVKGNYDKCIRLYQMLKENLIEVNYGITVSGENKDFIINNYRSMRHQIKAVTFVHSGGIYKKTNKPEISDIYSSLLFIYKNYVLDSIAELIELIHIKIAVLFVKNGQRSNIIPCEVIDTSLHIKENGDIQPCMFLEPIGNIKTENIRDVLQTDAVSELKKRIKKDQCPHCWMNCYSIYSIMAHPFRSIFYLLK